MMKLVTSQEENKNASLQTIAEERPSRAERAFGPVAAGLLLDFIDLVTFGPIGIFFGMAAGGLLVNYICHLYGMPFKKRLVWILAAGIYCTVPLTEFIPAATLFGAYLRYREMAKNDKDEPVA